MIVGRYVAMMSAVGTAICLGLAGPGGGAASAAPPGLCEEGAASRRPLPPECWATAAPTEEEAVRFLVQASFGPDSASIAAVRQLGYEGWIAAQMALPLEGRVARLDRSGVADPRRNTLVDANWEAMIEAEDQLRQRVAYALSQIVVVSQRMGLFGERPRVFAAYQDILLEEAFGNYGDLVERASLNPAMGRWLTHLGSEKADPVRGVEPDENYAREVMQLFTIGLEELNPDGTGTGVETYTTEDVKGLAAVFTGLNWAGGDWATAGPTDANAAAPMQGYPAFHEAGPKTFLGHTVDRGADPEASVRDAVAFLIAHPNTGPFVSRQLIQRLVTSNPSPAYVGRVAAAFDAGRYTLPSGAVMGTGRKGDMAPVVAAVLLDEQARNTRLMSLSGGGKVREPVLRFTHWARAFGDGPPAGDGLASSGSLRRAQEAGRLSQQPFRSPSVFNFYRPGYVAGGSLSAAAGLVAPEMQITTTGTVPGYIDYMFGVVRDGPGSAYRPDYAEEEALAHDAAALVARLDALLAYGTLGEETKDRMRAAVSALPQADRRARVELAVFMAVTAPAYAVQR